MRPWIRWLAFGLWSLLIFAAAPFANSVQAWISEHLGASALRNAVAVLLLGSIAGLSLRWWRHRSRFETRRLLWILAIASAALVVLWRLRVAAEPAHLAQYSLLGGLAYWALCAHLEDRGVHLAAAALTTIVGTLDEIVQWLLPNRYWDFADVGLNATAAVLVQLLIWQGFRPAHVAAGVGPRSLRLTARLAAGEALLLLLCAANTPHRIDAYAASIPGLAYLGRGLDTRMTEYGHRYVDPEIGLFRSRLDPEQLARADRELGEEAGRILAGLAGKSWYNRLHLHHPPHRAPFVSEMGTHLFYRQRLLQRADEASDAEEKARLATIAYRENLILERYFPTALASSRTALAEADRQRLAALHLPAADFESEVSNWLVTALSEAQLRWTLLAGLAGLVALERAAGRRLKAQRAS